MSASQEAQPTLDSIAPRFVVGDMEQALAFYEQLGFETTYQDEGFAIVERDGIDVHLNASSEPPKGRSVCWIGATNIEALYQQYLPTNAVQSPLEAKPWRMKEFFLCDPFRNLILFAEGISEEEARCTGYLGYPFEKMCRR
jgi:catechol 2,3-dioxygenase-like lactoylglutathione lyase family enzyme